MTGTNKIVILYNSYIIQLLYSITKGCEKLSREKLAEQIFEIFPVFHRKLFKRKPDSQLPQQLMHVLHDIQYEDGRPMKFYCDKMMISKPNMTKIVNKLIEENLVTRGIDVTDRRIITLHITEQGKEIVNTQFKEMKRQIVESLDPLSEEDIKQLNDSFETIRRIFGKLQSHKE